MDNDLYRLTLRLDPAQEDAAEAFLADAAPQGWEESALPDQRMQFVIHLESQDLGFSLLEQVRQRWPQADAELETVQRENWAMAWKDFFVPVSCGERFEILPPWLADQAHDGMTPIVIEPKMAFGTGHHPTTALCLAALAELFRARPPAPDRTFLDLGTGSGILAIALAKLGMEGLGADIDPQAIECAEENLEINDVSDKIELLVGSVDELGRDRRFDLVVANILSGPLIDMAPRLVRRVAPGGSLVLSGILAGDQARQVADAYVRQGLAEPAFTEDGEWAALTWTEIG